MVTPDLPRSLLLTPIVPQPTGNGLAMRAALAVEALSRVSQVFTAVIPVSGPADEKALAWVRARSGKVVCPPLPDSLEASSSWLASPRGRQLVQSVPLLPPRARQAAPACGIAAANLLGQTRFDIVYVLRSYLAGAALPFLALAGTGSHRLLDADEDDARVLRELSSLHTLRNEPGQASATLAEAAMCEDFLRASRGWFDTLLSSSDQESENLRTDKLEPRLATVPNAVNLPAKVRPKRHSNKQGPRLLYLGNLGYLPNQDAAERLALGILPRIRESQPDARLDIVGAGSHRLTPAVTAAPGVTVRGYVEDLEVIYAGADIMVVPLRVGGGTRLKLLEAAARQLPIVATTKAAEGLGWHSEIHYLAAESDEEMAHSTSRMLKNHELAHSLATMAAKHVTKHHSMVTVADKLAHLVSAGNAGAARAGTRIEGE